ncbi:MAG: hypothetical protein AAF226_04270 [Verrucomicrobiota bacterium]
MIESTEKRLLELAGLLCDEKISDEQFAELDGILNTDPEAREIYRRFLSMHQHLETGALETDSEWPKSPTSLSRPLLWMVGLVSLLLATGLVLNYVIPRSDEGANFAETIEPVPDFVLTRAIDVEWEHSHRFQAQLGQPITERYLRLQSGIAQVEFASGATVTIEGPAKLRLDGPMKCFSHHGKLAANCPPSAHGFLIRFPGGRVIDLGTEFALNTDPAGQTEVHVLEGEVKVATMDKDERVLNEQSLLRNSAVTTSGHEIETITYDDSPFTQLKRDRLVQSQPIKVQFDLGHRAGLYTGTNAPAHAAGDMFAHENVWTQIVGDQAGTFVMADGNICPHPLKVDYGHGDGQIDWDATPVDPWGKVYSKARGVFDSALCQDHRPWDDDLGLRVSGLPAGSYRIYALCRSVRRPGASYDVSFGVNLDKQQAAPTIISSMEQSQEETGWVAGLTYAVGEVEISGPDDWATFITRYSRERSTQSTPHHGRSVLLGLQIVAIH